MPITTTLLFDCPQHELASCICRKLDTSIFTQIVSGFATVEGIKSLEISIAANPSKIDAILIGAGTYRTYEALDHLISIGVPLKSLYVHLGHTRQTKPGAQHPFYRYHPMLHSKIYYMEHEDGTASAIIGSHNVTGFAMLGLNGEASVLLEGPKDEKQFEEIRRHIQHARAQSVNYSPREKEAYSWWTTKLMEGLSDKTRDIPETVEKKTTIVILGQSENWKRPKKDDIIYFELPSALKKLNSLGIEVHIYLFKQIPPSPCKALQSLNQAIESYWAKIIGVETKQGGVELKADWYVDNHYSPVLKATPKPFRPEPSPDMQQVRVSVRNNVFNKFKYIFGQYSPEWEPILDTESAMQVTPEQQDLLEKLNLVQPEHMEWFLVKELRKPEADGEGDYAKALQQLSPESGSYVMISLCRRTL